MATQVWKFPLVHGWNEITHPPGQAQVLSVGPDLLGDPCCWVIVSPDEHGMSGTLSVLLCWTGEDINTNLAPEDLHFLGTFHAHGYVFHGFVDVSRS